MTLPASARLPALPHLAVLVGSAISLLGALVLLGGVQDAGALLVLTGIGIVAAGRPVVAVWAIILLLPVHPIATRMLQVSGLSGWPFVAISAWKELALAVALTALGIGILQRMRAGVTPLRGPTGIGDYLALGLVLLVGIAVVIDPSIRAINGARLMLVPVGIYAAIRLQRIASDRLFVALVLTGTAIAAFGIVQGSWLGWDFVQRFYAGEGVPIPATFTAQHLEGPRAAGTLLSPNEFAFAVAAYLCMATALVLRVRSTVKWLLVPVLVLLVLGIAVAFSRSALLGSILSLGAIGVLGARRSLQPRTTALALLLAFIPAVAISVIVYADRGGLALLHSSFVTIVDVDTSPSAPATSSESPAPDTSLLPSDVGGDQRPDPSTIGHISSLVEGWRLVVAHPLGVGLGNVGARPYPGSAERPQYVVESWYLAMGLSLGWLGLVWAIVFPAAIGVAAVRALHRERAVLWALAAVGLAALLAFVSLLLPTLMEPEVAMLPWVVIGFLANAKRTPSPVTPADADRARGTRDIGGGGGDPGGTTGAPEQ